ncbi:MAG: methylmalonyl-CoA mutase, partial [Candidatus Bathyarchaeota archaeon]
MYDKQRLSKISKESDRWEKTILPKWLSNHPERKNEFNTTSDTLVKRLYTPDDVKEIDYLTDLGFPGRFPFTRGVHATMYRGRLWTMRQFSGFGTAEQTNQRFRYL